MSIKKVNGAPSSPEKTNPRRRKLGALFSSDPSVHEDHNSQTNTNDHIHVSSKFFIDYSPINMNMTVNNTSDLTLTSTASSPYNNNSASPWSLASPYMKSPWVLQPAEDASLEEDPNPGFSKFGLIGSLRREEGHIYSLATSGDFLYTGSDSKNVRVWKGMQDFSGFKSNSGLVKAIVVLEDRIFTGHQDGKIRVWRYSADGRNTYKRVGNLPTTRDLWWKSFNPKNYTEVRRNRNVPWIKHYDAVSCLSIDKDQGLLYSGSWDKTFKVWRISDFKCLESVAAHIDAVNSVVIGIDGLIFTGSADGTVKAWRREMVGKYPKHVLVETLLKQDHALTSLTVSHDGGVLYAGSSDGLVSFWEREKHFMSYGGVLRGHKLAVLCLAAAGNLVLSGSADKSICVWRRDNGGVHTCVAVLNGHSEPVKCLSVEEEAVEEEEECGKRWIVYSGSLDKSVKVWRVSEHAPSFKELQQQCRDHGASLHAPPTTVVGDA